MHSKTIPATQALAADNSDSHKTATDTAPLPDRLEALVAFLRDENMPKAANTVVEAVSELRNAAPADELTVPEGWFLRRAVQAWPSQDDDWLVEFLPTVTGNHFARGRGRTLREAWAAATRAMTPEKTALITMLATDVAAKREHFHALGAMNRATDPDDAAEQTARYEIARAELAEAERTLKEAQGL